MTGPRRPISEVRQIGLQVLVSALLVAIVAAGGITVVELGGRSGRAGAHMPTPRPSRAVTRPAAATVTTGASCLASTP